MSISPQSLDLFTKNTLQNYNSLNQPVLSEESMEDFLAENLPPSCPGCGNDQLVKHGKTLMDRQRWKCTACGHTFVGTKSTPFYRSRSSYPTWRRFMRCVERRIPIRECAAICGISLPTAIRWRRRYLECLVQLFKAAVYSCRDQGLCDEDVDWEEIDKYIEDEVHKYSRGKSDMPRKRQCRMSPKGSDQHFH